MGKLLFIHMHFLTHIDTPLQTVIRKEVQQMTIRFNLNFDDLLAFQQDVIKSAHIHRIKERYFKWITAIVLFLAALILMKISLVTVVISLVITIIYFITFPFLYAKVVYLKLSKQMQKNDYSHVLGACEMTITGTGIVRELKDKTTHFDWGDFERLREDSHHYFLYVSDTQGLIIRKEPDGINEKDKVSFHDLIGRRADLIMHGR